MTYEYSAFKIEGFDEVYRKLGYLPTEIYYELLPVLNDGLRMLLEEAKFNAPVASGKLRQSLKITNEQSDFNKSNVYGRVTTNVWYAQLMEYGFLQTGPKPKKVIIGVNDGKAFLRPALYSNENEILELTIKRTNKIIEKFNRKL